MVQSVLEEQYKGVAKHTEWKHKQETGRPIQYIIQNGGNIQCSECLTNVKFSGKTDI